MKIRMLRTPADSFGCPLREGEEGNVPDAVGKTVIKAGIAIELEEPVEERPKRQRRQPKQVDAVPSKPAIAETKPATISGDTSTKSDQPKSTLKADDKSTGKSTTPDKES